MRPHFNSPIPRTGTPRFPEVSTLVSPRDPDVLMRQHFKLADGQYNLDSIVRFVVEVKRQFDRMRVRTGGATVVGSGTGTYGGEWDPNRPYTAGQIVVITSGSNAGTFGCNVSNTGQAPYAGGGFWTQLPLGNLGQWL